MLDTSYDYCNFKMKVYGDRALLDISSYRVIPCQNNKKNSWPSQIWMKLGSYIMNRTGNWSSFLRQLLISWCTESSSWNRRNTYVALWRILGLILVWPYDSQWISSTGRTQGHAVLFALPWAILVISSSGSSWTLFIATDTVAVRSTGSKNDSDWLPVDHAVRSWGQVE